VAAEIGIGVAGFSSIAAALFTRSRPGKNHAQWLQFRTLLVTSFGVTLLAYIPMVLGSTSLEEPGIWTASSAVYFVWVLLNSVIAFSDQEFRTLLRTRGATRLFAMISMVFVILSFSLNLMNSLFVHASWPYLTALACGISIAFIQFASMLHMLWNADASPA